MAQRCSATSKRTGQPCQQYVTIGATVCRWHGGAAPAAMANTRKRAALAKVSAEMSRLGMGIEVDPAEALLAMVYEAAGNVAFLRAQVAELATHPTLKYVTRFDDEGDDDGHEIRVVESGLYGPDHLGDARPHALLVLYDAERTRLANFARMALAAGCEERRVRLAESAGAQVVDVIVATLDDAALGLTPAQREAGRRVAAGHLRRLTPAA